MTDDARRQLRELARLRGVQLSYTDNRGKTCRASVDTLVGVLTALGHRACDASAITAELALARHEHEQTVVPPVVVRDRSGGLSQPIRFPPGVDPRRCHVEVHREDGGIADLAAALPPGYHQLVVEGPGIAAEAMLLVPPRLQPGRGLGVMAPVYALRGHNDWGVGTFTDLADLASLARSWGCDLVGSLPLFAASFREPIDPSPYLPVSRMFWNELYVDLAVAAELSGCSSVDTFRPRERAGAGQDVDYDAVVRAKRDALDACAASMETAAGRRREDFESFLASQPGLGAYADFRADGDPTVARYHRFAQYVATRQLEQLADRPDTAGLYLDLPVGVHPDGYDTWAHPELFAAAQVGAPPDALAAAGQAWGFPPLHPQRLRQSRYSYFIGAMRHVLRFAEAVRLDHILGLRRLYWIPPGADAHSGAYVRYQDDEMRAIVAIEAHRAGAVVIGEDLGTVSPEIRRGMDDVGVLHSFVYQFAASAREPFPQPHVPSAASLGSHDLPRFATFWADPAQRDLVDAIGIPEPRRALEACLECLAAGPASYVFADLADLEGATEPDNRPGTGSEAGNWRHRLPRPIEALAADDGLRRFMSELAELRAAATEKGAA